jgi:4-alpha-glucanotransferase
VSATLEDALAVKQRPNMPGATAECWPSWSIALPKSQEELEQDRLTGEVVQALKRS